MQAYCDSDTIFFQISSSTGFASDKLGKKGKGAYKGSPPYKLAQIPYSEELKLKHSAEHKVYNAFIKKIAHIKEDMDLEKLENFIPSYKEAKDADDFSLFCGSTYYLGSAMILLLSTLPNIFQFYNTNLIFMPIWMFFCIFATYYCMRLIQKQFFLATAKDSEIKLALIAIKEAFKHARNNKL
jgi:hypothetical protein